jgi:anti-sigma factor RsiW
VSRNNDPVGSEELSACLDGELEEARRGALERHLADHPEAAARLAEYRRRDEALRLAFAELGADRAWRPLARLGKATARGKGRLRLALAAAVFGVILGATAGLWYESASLKDRTLATLWREAVTAHLLYAGQERQSPVVAAERERISARLSALLEAEVKAPELSMLGLRLVEWRELPADRGPAALLVYRDADGRDVSCYFKRLADSHETGFTVKAAGGTNVVYRLYEHLGYAVVGALPANTLQKIAEVGYHEDSAEDQ